MSEFEPGHEAHLKSERVISPAEHAYLEYLLATSDQLILELEAENEWLKHDQLTGVLVASVIRSELEKRVETAAVTAEPFALIFGDVDNMKAINTEYGYEGGDDILAAVGRACRKDDLVGRAGGDELWWIADLKPREQLHTQQTLRMINTTPEQQASAMATSFETRANAEIKKLKLGTEVGFSVGIAIYSHGDTTKDLISRANQEMTERKERNKGLRKSQGRHPSNQKP